MSDHDHIEKLKTAADPDRVAAALGIQSRGGRYFCPSCQPDGGKTPDLVIRGQGFFCHKCGLKGDVLKLIQEAAGLDFPAAVAWLERETGIPGPGRKRGYRDQGRGEKSRPGPSHEADAGKDAGVHAEVGIFSAFLESCRPIEGRVMDWLKGRGVGEDVVAVLGLRFCGREYEDIMKDLTARFGEDALLAAGMMKRSKAGRPVPSFWHYFANRAGFLVIPYMQDGQPVYLKVRPPLSKAEAEDRGLVRFMNTAAVVPCLYNADVLKGQLDRVMICEGESDTWAALSGGWPAVGTPGAKNFKEAWTEAFRGIEDADGRSLVFLVLDADKAGDDGARVIADIFLKAGLPVPLRVVLPWGQDLTDYLRE